MYVHTDPNYIKASLFTRKHGWRQQKQSFNEVEQTNINTCRV
jgi:hypothetical protein